MCFVFPSPPLPFVISPAGREVGTLFFCFSLFFFFLFWATHPQNLFSNSPPRSTRAPFRRPSPSSPIKEGESVGFVVPRGDCAYSQVHSRQCARLLVFVCKCVHMLQLAFAGAPKSQVLLKNIHPHSCARADAHTCTHTHTSRPLRLVRGTIPLSGSVTQRLTPPASPGILLHVGFGSGVPPKSTPPPTPPPPPPVASTISLLYRAHQRTQC